MPSNRLILCRLLLLPPIFPSIRVFSNESYFRMRWPKYWSFSFSTSPSNEHSGLIPLRMDWLDLLAVQGTLKSLLQHHSSEASILLHSAFFIAQLSYPYMTTGKTIALTRWTFVGKVMSLLFNVLSSWVITLPEQLFHFSLQGLETDDRKVSLAVVHVLSFCSILELLGVHVCMCVCTHQECGRVVLLPSQLVICVYRHLKVDLCLIFIKSFHRYIYIYIYVYFIIFKSICCISFLFNSINYFSFFLFFFDYLA